MNQDIQSLYETAHAEGVAAFGFKNLDVSVTRDTDMEDDSLYIARVTHNHTLAIACAGSPEDALTDLISRIRVLAWRRSLEAKTRADYAAGVRTVAVAQPSLEELDNRDHRSTLPTLPPQEEVSK